MGPKTYVFMCFGPFLYCTKFDAKLDKVVALTHKFAKQSRVRIFRNERNRSKPLVPKLMFLDVPNRFVTARKLMQKLPN
jgi:hypothetical protein